MDLFDAWRLWWEGHSVLDLELWGLEITWWGRIGKVLQFVGALTVVLDIIGPERLLAFGDSLRTASPFRGVVGRARERWQPLWEWARAARAGTPSVDLTSSETRRGIVQLAVRGGLLVLGLVIGLVFASWGWLLVLAVLVGGLAFIALAAVVSLVGQAVFTVVIKPFATVIARPNIDAWAKSAGIVLLMAGFHFDLLAS